MKKTITYLTLFSLLLMASGVFAQGAGNWYLGQSVANPTKKGVLDGVYIQENNIDRRNYYASERQRNTGANDIYRVGGNRWVNDTIIELRTNVLMNAEADGYIAILGVVQVSKTIEDGHQQLNERIEKFKAAIAAKGIKEDDIHIDFISQVPVFEREIEKKLFSKSSSEIPKGFELQKNIHIRFSKQSVIEDIIIAGAKSEIYDIIKVEHVINDMQQLYDTLRHASMDLLKNKIKDFEQIDVAFEPMYQTITESIGSVAPLDRYSTYKSFSNANIDAARRSKDGTYRVNKPVTLYYDKISYNNYDMVINPGTIKPSVQLGYQLTMKYVLKKRL
jgi:uncharacterized protein YggE